MPAPRKPILIAGPTASGKSQLALQLAKAIDGVIINADALQVYDAWQVLTARPSADERAQAPHLLYGFVSPATAYSVGAWLRDLANALQHTTKTPIIIGGTGLYFSALTTGLADIPAISAPIRAEGNDIRRGGGADEFINILRAHDPISLARLDQNNPMRLQRAWEVWAETGRGLADWQANASPPLMPLSHCNCCILNIDTHVLDDRISTRFDAMLAAGALDEVRAYLAAGWDMNLPASRAIGLAELARVVTGVSDFQTEIAAAKLASRQYAKRQRSWFRNRMSGWQQRAFTSPTARSETYDALLQQE